MYSNVQKFSTSTPYTLNPKPMTTTQQLPSNPALDFADLVLTETNNGLELIDILHDIAQGIDEDATTHDRITASNILLDRGLGKCPKQLRIPSTESERDPESAESDNHANHSSDTPHNAPGSPRLVTRIDESLNQSIGPAPSAHTPISPSRHSGEGRNPRSGSPLGNPEVWGGTGRHTPQSPDPLDPSSVHFIIQQHILDITNSGRTLFDTLAEIARAKDSPKAKPCHRARASRILIDRVLGTAPTSVLNVALSETSPIAGKVEEKPIDKEAWERVAAELKELEKKYNLDPNRVIPRNDYSHHMPPDDFDFTPYLHEADEFRAKIALQAERRRKWPEIEERRRKKLAQIYPSHSEDDGDPPDP